MEINGEQINKTARYDELNLSPADAGHRRKGLRRGHRGPGRAIPFFMECKDVLPRPPPARARPLPSASPWWSIRIRRATSAGPCAGPTRELAMQIQEELRTCANQGGASVCLYGGRPIDKQITTPEEKPQIVVATPGGLMDHMKRRTVRLDKVQTVVLDEADRMLDMGFMRDVTRILDELKHRKTWACFPPPSPGRSWTSPGCTSGPGGDHRPSDGGQAGHPPVPH